MGLVTNVQELPGVTQKAHNAPFLAWPAGQRTHVGRSEIR